jgi:hypothetical protein
MFDIAFGVFVLGWTAIHFMWEHRVLTGALVLAIYFYAWLCRRRPYAAIFVLFFLVWEKPNYVKASTSSDLAFCHPVIFECRRICRDMDNSMAGARSGNYPLSNTIGVPVICNLALPHTFWRLLRNVLFCAKVRGTSD